MSKQTSPLGRLAEAEETIELVVFAESPAGCYVNGAALHVHSSPKGVIPASQVPVTAKGKIYEPISGRSGHRRTHRHRPRYRHQVWPCVGPRRFLTPARRLRSALVTCHLGLL